jgi:hypothetical protein
VTPPSGSSPGTASGVTPPSGGGVVVPQAVIVTGPNGKVKDCYKDATSLAARAELNEKDAKDMMDAQEQCSRNEAEEKLAAAYIETGGIYKDPQVAHDQARKDMKAIDDYAKAKGLSQGDRIELNMNIAVGLATGDLTLNEFKGMRDKAKEYTDGKAACNGAYNFTKCDNFLKKEFQNPGAFDLLKTSRNELSPKNRNTIARARASSEKNIKRAVDCHNEIANMNNLSNGLQSLGALGFSTPMYVNPYAREYDNGKPAYRDEFGIQLVPSVSVSSGFPSISFLSPTLFRHTLDNTGTGIAAFGTQFTIQLSTLPPILSVTPGGSPSAWIPLTSTDYPLIVPCGVKG